MSLGVLAAGVTLWRFWHEKVAAQVPAVNPAFLQLDAAQLTCPAGQTALTKSGPCVPSEWDGLARFADQACDMNGENYIA